VGGRPWAVGDGVFPTIPDKVRRGVSEEPHFAYKILSRGELNRRADLESVELNEKGEHHDIELGRVSLEEVRVYRRQYDQGLELPRVCMRTEPMMSPST